MDPSPTTPHNMPPHIRESNKEFYQKAAEAVFAKNPERKYAEDPEFYARSVEEKLWELKAQYREFNLALGPVGASLPPEEIKEGTELHDLVARLSVDFPHWKKLHSVWRTEPNVNPYAPSVELPTMENPSSESTEVDMLVVNYMQLEGKRLEAQTAEHLTQRAKYENETARVNADLELKKLKHQERLLQMQHQREREKEEHQLRTLELQLALRESENRASVSARPFMPSPAHTSTPLNP